MTVSVEPKPRGSSTICLPCDKGVYQQCIGDPAQFRRFLDQAFRDMPELFPVAFAYGYTLKDSRASKKAGLTLRRIQCNASGESFTIRPCFVLSYMTGLADEVEKALFLRRFGVPFWALARVFGKNPMYWYRLEASLGRNSVVGTGISKRGSTCMARGEYPSGIVGRGHCYTTSHHGRQRRLGGMKAAGVQRSGSISTVTATTVWKTSWFRLLWQDIADESIPQNP